MIVWKNKFIPFGRYSTMNFFGILITKDDNLSEKTIRHESIHTKQMKEMLYIGFYAWYIIEYFIIRFFHLTQNCSYRDISLEEEAYAHDMEIDYLNNRKHYAWFKYIKIKSNKSTGGCNHL